MHHQNKMALPFLPQALSAIGCRPTIEGKEILPNNYIFDYDAFERMAESTMDESDHDQWWKDTPEQAKLRAEKL